MLRTIIGANDQVFFIDPVGLEELERSGIPQIVKFVRPLRKWIEEKLAGPPDDALLIEDLNKEPQ